MANPTADRGALAVRRSAAPDPRPPRRWGSRVDPITSPATYTARNPLACSDPAAPKDSSTSATTASG